MENLLSTEVIVLVLTSLFGAIGWLVKHYFDKKDEEQKKIFEERDADKQNMKEQINELRTEVKQTSRDLKSMQALIIGCEHDDCPNRALLKDYLLNKTDN